MIKLNRCGELDEPKPRKGRSRRTARQLIEYVQHHAEQLVATGHTGNARNYRGLANNLRSFPDGSKWRLDNTSREIIGRFHTHLLKRKIKRNTISAYMRPLKAILKQAYHEGLGPYDSRWFAGIYLGVDKTVKRAIKRDAMVAICRLDLSRDPLLQLSRDLFLFSFYMRGMAFADVARLTVADIIDGEIVYARRKTKQILRIPIEPQAMAIVNRYRSGHRTFLFPVIKEDTQRCYDSALRAHNGRLKRIARLAGVDMRLSSYMSRHSWATIARDMGVDINVISAGMGHNSVLTTQIYLDTIDNERLNEANRLVTAL